MSEAERDYYEVLGVPRDADGDTIKARYRHLAQHYHPDRNKAPDAEQKFKEIAKAYAVLHDPNKRAAYDARGSAGVAHFSHEDLFGGIDFSDLFGDIGLSDSMFGRMFGMRGTAGNRGADVAVTLSVPLECIDGGGEELVHYPKQEPCSSCGGSGAEAGTAPRECARCNGKGTIMHTRKDSGVTLQRIVACDQCHGHGRLIDHPCPVCAGAGRVEHDCRVKVHVPAGAREGLVLRVSGHGLAGSSPGVPAGDLMVTVRSRRDPRFDRRGDDLWHLLPVSVTDAALGAKHPVPTLSGAARVTLPPGTQPGTVLRLKGKGLTRYSRDGRGDLMVVVSLQIPTRLSDAQRKAYENLRLVEGERRATTGGDDGCPSKDGRD